MGEMKEKEKKVITLKNEVKKGYKMVGVKIK